MKRFALRGALVCAAFTSIAVASPLFAAARPVRVDAILSLSGSYAAVGTMERNALVLAADVVNRTGGIDGRPLDLVVHDDQSSAGRALATTTGVISSAHPAAIIGGSVSGICAAMRAETEAAQTVQYCLSGGGGASSTFFASFPDAGRLFGDLPATWMRSRGVARVAIVDRGDRVGSIYERAFRSAATGERIAVVGVVHGRGDIAQSVDAALARGAQAFYLGGDVDLDAAVLHALRRRDSQALVWMTSSLARAGVAERLAPVVPPGGIYGAGDTIGIAEHLPWRDPRRDLLLRYIAQFRSFTGVRPDIYAAVAADAAEFVVAGLRATGGRGGVDLADSMHRMPPAMGLYATYRFTPSRRSAAELPATVVELQSDGTLRYVGDFAPDGIPRYANVASY